MRLLALKVNGGDGPRRLQRTRFETSRPFVMSQMLCEPFGSGRSWVEIMFATKAGELERHFGGVPRSPGGG